MPWLKSTACGLHGKERLLMGFKVSQLQANGAQLNWALQPKKGDFSKKGGARFAVAWEVTDKRCTGFNKLDRINRSPGN